MLSPADAELCTRDLSFRALTFVLDSERILAAISDAFPDLHPLSATATYVRYKPGTNATVQWQIETLSGSSTVTLKAFVSPPRRIQTHASEHPAQAVILNDGFVLATRMPFDPELPALPDYIDAGGELLHYRPGRRAVVRDSSGSRLIKLHGAQAFRAIAAREAPPPATGARFQAPLFRNSAHKAITYRWADGDPLAKLSGFALRDGAIAAGQALARLHQQQPPATWTGGTPPSESLASAINAIRRLMPGLAEPLAKLAAALQETIDLHAGFAPVHGDFSAQQVVVGTDTTVIDFDEAHTGDPEEDIGSFLAKSGRDFRTGTESCTARTAFLEGYGAAGGQIDERKLRREQASSLIRIAPEPFRHRHPDWRVGVARLVKQAIEALDGR